MIYKILEMVVDLDFYGIRDRGCYKYMKILKDYKILFVFWIILCLEGKYDVIRIVLKY